MAEWNKRRAKFVKGANTTFPSISRSLLVSAASRDSISSSMSVTAITNKSKSSPSKRFDKPRQVRLRVKLPRLDSYQKALEFP